MHTYTREELEAFLVRLWGAKAVLVDFENGFLLKQHVDRPGAKRSPFKINLATPAMRPEGRLTEVDIKKIARFMWLQSQELGLRFDGVAGVPHAGNPLAEEFVRVAYHEDAGRDLARLTLDKYAEGGKRHVGKLLKVTRELPRGSTVLLLDDVATKGESKEEAAEMLRLEDYKVSDCLVFADREQGAAESLQDIQLRLHSVTTAAHMFELYAHRNFISHTELEHLLETIGTET